MSRLKGLIFINKCGILFLRRVDIVNENKEFEKSEIYKKETDYTEWQAEHFKNEELHDFCQKAAEWAKENK